MAARLVAAWKRQKPIENTIPSPLAKVLTLKDLILLGTGGALGLGAYVLAGQLAKTVAGPAVCLSFLLAGVACGVGGLCYAEFAARVPRTGWLYIYTYVSIGEGMAFIIGWNIILGCILSIAGTARGLSAYIDSLVDNQMRRRLTEVMPINVGFLSPYLDFLSGGFVIIGTVIIALGVRESSISQNFFALVNVATILTAVVAAATKINFHNWNINVDDIDEESRKNAGSGGFLPFGIAGVIAGAPRCFYGFTGFDLAASCGEEAINPRRDIPLSIILSLINVSITYLAISITLTLAFPYYLQSEEAAFVHLFQQLDWQPVKWIVSIGAIFALCSTFLAALYPLPRVIYAMANDGLLFRSLSNIHPKTKTPLLATIIAGLFTCVIATLLNLEDLMDLTSFGGLFSYVIISASVVTLRYSVSNTEMTEKEARNKKKIFTALLNLTNHKTPNQKSSMVVKWSIVLFGLLCYILCSAVTYGGNFPSKLGSTIVAACLSMIMLAVVTVIARQPIRQETLSFKVPLIPITPCLSMLFNSYLMVQLNFKTWLMAIGWMIIGFLVYLLYGMKHSEENKGKQDIRTLDKSTQNTTL